MEVKDRLRQLRKEQGYTQKELSEKSGLAIVTIRQYESGKRKPNFEALLKLSEAFHLNNITELYDAENQAIDKKGNLVTPDEKLPDRDQIGQGDDLEQAFARASEDQKEMIRRILRYNPEQVAAFLSITQSLSADPSAPDD